MYTAQQSKQAGYSLIELAVVIAITSILAGLSITGFTAFSRSEALDGGTASIVAGLRDARAKTLASVEGSQYGVYMQTDRYTLFKGSSYSASAASNTITFLNSYIKASSTPSTFVFQRVTGNAVASGTIDVYLITDPLKKRTISIAATGLVDTE